MGIFCRSNEELQTHLTALRGEGMTVVTTNGCFDIISLAHVRMLREASLQGDVLVVGINSDASIRKLKGPDRPIRKEDERAEIVAAMEMVSFVVLFDERESTSFVARVRPDVHVNDATYGEDCVEAKVLKEYGGRLHLIPKFQWESNSDLVERIRTLS